MRVTDVQRRSTRSQTMSCSKYLISIERFTFNPESSTFALYGDGTYWCMYVKDGDKSYSSHQTVSTSKSSAHAKLLSGRILVSGQTFPSLLITTFLKEA